MLLIEIGLRNISFEMCLRVIHEKILLRKILKRIREE